jgi:uncharacterized protein (UPF0262 family)
MSAVRHLQRVRLRDDKTVRRQTAIEQEIKAAIADLLQEHHFVPQLLPDKAPYELTLGLEEHRLILELHDADGMAHPPIRVSLQSLRPIIRDYFIMCESHYAAVASPNRVQLEAIDAGRRGTHNEGAETLRTLLAESITLDLCTARRLFTLVAALHLGGWSTPRAL